MIAQNVKPGTMAEAPVGEEGGIWVGGSAGMLVYLDVFFSSRRRHTRCLSDWSSDVCSSDLCHVLMQLENVRMFCDLVETQSFTRAAEKQGVTLSAVSQRLGTMEKEFSAKLAVRSRHGFQLTAAGVVCYELCREMIRLAEEMERQIHSAKTTTGGVLELAACYSIGLHQLPPLLKRFQQDFPAVEVRVRYGLIDWVHEEVTEDVVDLGLVCYPRRLPGLAIEPFRHERLMLVCHPQHPLAARPSVTVAELTGQKFVAWTDRKST